MFKLKLTVLVIVGFVAIVHGTDDDVREQIKNQLISQLQERINEATTITVNTDVPTTAEPTTWAPATTSPESSDETSPDTQGVTEVVNSTEEPENGSETSPSDVTSLQPVVTTKKPKNHHHKRHRKLSDILEILSLLDNSDEDNDSDCGCDGSGDSSPEGSGDDDDDSGCDGSGDWPSEGSGDDTSLEDCDDDDDSDEQHGKVILTKRTKIIIKQEIVVDTGDSEEDCDEDK